MDFKLDIGELTNTIRDYENSIRILAEQKENINKTIAELTEAGWSGAAKDQFEQNHSKKQESYTKLEEDFKYVENAMEREEKPEAVKLKKRCEGFEDCIKRSAGGAALTHDDVGTISLQYSGQAQINNNVDECINNHYKKMDSKFVEIQNLLNSLTFTSFPIGEDIEKARKSLKDQTTSLTDFKDSFNEYCSGVKTMESNICSTFGKISGITEGMSKFRGIFDISEGGQVDKNKVRQLMLKNPNSLTNEEKELLSYMEKILGEKEYAKLKEQGLNQKEKEDFVSKLKYAIEIWDKVKNPTDVISNYHGIDKLLNDFGIYNSIKNTMGENAYNTLTSYVNGAKGFVDNPVNSFNYLNNKLSETDFAKYMKNNQYLHKYYLDLKFRIIRNEALISDGVNIVKSPFELLNLNEETNSKLTNITKIELDRAFGTNGMDDDETYKKALSDNAQELYYAQNKTYNTIKNIPKGIWEDAKATSDISKIKDFFLNPNMSLDDAQKWSQSAINTGMLFEGGKSFIKGKLPVNEKVSISESTVPLEIKTISEDIKPSEMEVINKDIKPVETGDINENLKTSEIEVINENAKPAEAEVINKDIKPSETEGVIVNGNINSAEMKAINEVNNENNLTGNVDKVNSIDEGVGEAPSAEKIVWPPNDGGILGTEKNIVLEKGYQFDRYGLNTGSYVAPVGTPYEMRSLAPGTEFKPYKVFEVAKPVRGEGSVIAPWFDQPGGGIQIKLNNTIQELLNSGRIIEVKK